MKMDEIKTIDLLNALIAQLSDEAVEKAYQYLRELLKK